MADQVAHPGAIQHHPLDGRPLSQQPQDPRRGVLREPRKVEGVRALGSLIAAAREAAAAHEAELTARFQQQVNGTTPQRDDDNLYA